MQIKCFNLHKTEVVLFKSAKKLDLEKIPSTWSKNR